MDFGYIRYFYPGAPAEFGYEYGELNLNVGYDFDIATLAGRICFSPHSFGDSGNSSNSERCCPFPCLNASWRTEFQVATTGMAGWADHDSLRTRL